MVISYFSDGTIREEITPEGHYVRYSRSGAILEDRLAAGDELSRVQAMDEASALELSRLILLDKARSAIANNLAFLDLPEPGYPLSIAAQRVLVDQVVALTRQVVTLIRLAADRFGSTEGT